MIKELGGCGEVLSRPEYELLENNADIVVAEGIVVNYVGQHDGGD